MYIKSISLRTFIQDQLEQNFIKKNVIVSILESETKIDVMTDTFEDSFHENEHFCVDLIFTKCSNISSVCWKLKRKGKQHLLCQRIH